MKRQDISNLEVCKAYQQYKKEQKEFPYEILAHKFSCDEKVAYSACERAAAFPSNLIEYGVSLRTGWLTEKGEQLIKNSI